MKNINWQGVYPVVTTQHFDDMKINFGAIQAMVDSLIKDVVAG